MRASSISSSSLLPRIIHYTYVAFVSQSGVRNRLYHTSVRASVASHGKLFATILAVLTAISFREEFHVFAFPASTYRAPTYLPTNLPTAIIRSRGSRVDLLVGALNRSPRIFSAPRRDALHFRSRSPSLREIRLSDFSHPVPSKADRR